MSYESAPATELVATHCAVCARPLVDAQSVEIGIGPDCRAKYGYDVPVEPELRREANQIVREIATSALDAAALRAALGHLHALGFDRLADRIEKRVLRIRPTRSGEAIEVTVEDVLVAGDHRDVEGVEVSCTRCGHEVEVFGRGEASMKRGCMMLRETCPRSERNFYKLAEPAAVPEPLSAPESPPEPVAIEVDDLGAVAKVAVAAAAALPFKLTAGQELALETVGRLMKRFDPSACFIVGFAGTGKTTALRVFAQQYGRPIVITPTGKAALRVKEATGLEAQTIHRWMYKPVEDERTGVVKFARRYPDEIDVPPSRLILLDEASMVGPDVWRDVWDTCKQLNLRLVCVGDGFQLPPVQAQNARPFSVLTPDFAAGLKAERVEMTEVLRQAQDSPVVRASMQLRAGEGIRSLYELPRIQTPQLAGVAVSTYQNGGVVVCHRNITRFKINVGVRATLGLSNEQPQPGEPLLVLKNNYDVGLYNGEALAFPGWSIPPDQFERVYDRWKQQEESARFGATLVGGKSPATLSIEEIHGKLLSGFAAIAQAASRWARTRDLYLGDTVAPHLHANFGYAYTVHKSQGSQWPYVLVILEPSVRLDEEEGRRWAYTAITRAQSMAAIFYGNV
jgi:exodeoxyribonuclease-5